MLWSDVIISGTQVSKFQTIHTPENIEDFECFWYNGRKNGNIRPKRNVFTLTMCLWISTHGIKK